MSTEKVEKKEGEGGEEEEQEEESLDEEPTGPYKPKKPPHKHPMKNMMNVMTIFAMDNYKTVEPDKLKDLILYLKTEMQADPGLRPKLVEWGLPKLLEPLWTYKDPFIVYQALYIHKELWNDMPFFTDTKQLFIIED
ncbi:hypothetical protein WDU94_006715 [Cyamophila willieti]